MKRSEINRSAVVNINLWTARSKNGKEKKIMDEITDPNGRNYQQNLSNFHV